MELRNLRTLVAIAEHQSFAAAADAIGLTQSAVSLHIKALEDQLQTTLFDRSTRPPILSPEGTVLVEKAREIIGLCDGLTDNLRGSRVVGTLDLGAMPTTITGVLPGALSNLNELHPELRIRLTSDLSAELMDEVRRGILDAAIVSEPTDPPAGMAWHLVAREPLTVIAPADAAGRTDKELLEALPFVRFKRFAWAGRLIDNQLRDRRIQVRSTMEVDSLEAVISMVAQGLGVSVAPKRSIRQPFPTSIRVVPFGKPPITRNIGLVERVGHAKEDMVRALHLALLNVSGGGDLT